MKVLNVAIREYMSTAATKGFIIGALVVPALIAAALPLIVKLAVAAEKDAPVVEGRFALVDETGQGALLSDRVRLRLEAEDSDAIDLSTIDPTESAQSIVAQATGNRSIITLEDLPPDEADALREQLSAPYTEGMTGEILAMAVVSPDAIVKGEEGYGGFELFHRRKLDDRVVGKMRQSVIGAVRDLRFDAAGIDQKQLAELNYVKRDIQEITESGESQKSRAELGIIMPFVMMILLMMSVMIGGQYLLTTTVEEKSSRVVEVLLSAVSPMELMFGKILGQMGVGLSIMVVYSGLGIAAATVIGVLSGVVTPGMLVALVVYFVLAYVMIAAMMAAVGSAVNEMREAQSLMTPIMLIVMIPYFLVFPISRAPNSTLSLVLSFIPPVSPFVMVIRMGSTTPPPLWQILVSIAVSAVGAYLCVWFAAKVFRIGLLMYGKPPNFKTLIKWVRMA